MDTNTSNEDIEKTILDLLNAFEACSKRYADFEITQQKLLIKRDNFLTRFNYAYPKLVATLLNTKQFTEHQIIYLTFSKNNLENEVNYLKSSPVSVHNCLSNTLNTLIRCFY